VGFHSLDKLCYLTNHRNILSVWVFYLIFAFFELQLRPNLFFWEVIEIIWSLFIAFVWIDLGSKFSVLIQVKVWNFYPSSQPPAMKACQDMLVDRVYLLVQCPCGAALCEYIWNLVSADTGCIVCNLVLIQCPCGAALCEYIWNLVSAGTCCIVCNLVLWGWTSSGLSDHVLWNMSIAIVYASLSMWFVFD